MSKVLYRKYRPESFKEMVGQEHVVRTLTNALKNDMISHAYLFSGPRGTGKTSMARLLAKAVNCLDRKGAEPCNKCRACTELSKGSSMDLVEIDAASHRGIDDIRELREGIRFSPTSLKYKVFIIDECHQLSKAASNALLKTLEEPPSHAIFVLATTEPQKMLPTILSRCQQFSFRLLKLPEIVQKMENILKKEKIETEESALYEIARAARGSLRDAESLLDQVITFAGQDKKIEAQEVKEVLGLVQTEAVAQFAKLIFKEEQKQAVDLLHQKQEQGMDLETFLQSLIQYLRLALILKIGGNKKMVLSQLTEEEAEKLQQNIESATAQQVIKILQEFLSASNKIRYSPLPQLPIELAIIASCQNT